MSPCPQPPLSPQYYDDTYPGAKEQKAFEKNIFAKTHRTDSTGTPPDPPPGLPPPRGHPPVASGAVVGTEVTSGCPRR